MSDIELLYLSIKLALATLDCWAIWCVAHSPFYSRTQRIAQELLVLGVPFIGAILALNLTNFDLPLSRFRNIYRLIKKLP